MFDSEKKNTDVPTDSPAVVPEADEPYAAVDQGAWRRGGMGRKRKGAKRKMEKKKKLREKRGEREKSG